MCTRPFSTCWFAKAPEDRRHVQGDHPLWIRRQVPQELFHLHQDPQLTPLAIIKAFVTAVRRHC